MKPKIETSKKLLISTMILFGSQLIISNLFTWFNKDTSIFMYTIPSTAGVLGANIVFYLNKAKTENLFKGKINYLKIKMDLMKTYPDQFPEINQELQIIEDSSDNKIQTDINESVQTDINIQNL